MSLTTIDPVTEVWEQIRLWPAERRRSLASRLIQSLNQEEKAVTLTSPASLIGAWCVDEPPSDAEVERILDEERQRKHG